MKAAITMQSARNGGPGRDDFCTPPGVVELLTAHWCIDLDPCSNTRSAVSPMRGRLFGGADDDGLSSSWGDMVDGGIAYVNPPYSQMAKWARKMAVEAEHGVPIIALVAARTDTRWWRTLWPRVDACAFWNGRLRFWLDGVPMKAKATFASASLGMNVSQRVFRRAFDGVATVVIP